MKPLGQSPTYCMGPSVWYLTLKPLVSSTPRLRSIIFRCLLLYTLS